MNSITKNFTYNILYQLLAIILPVITIPYISRVLGPTKLGIYSYTYSTAHYFLIFAMLGVSNYGNRSVAFSRDDVNLLRQKFFSIYGFQLLTSIISIFLYFIYLAYFNSNNKDISIIQTIYLMSCLVDITWFFHGMEKFKITVSRNIVIKLVTVALIFMFVKTAEDLWLYTFILSTGTFISHLVMWLFIKRYVKFYLPSFKEIIVHAKPNFTLFIPVIAVSIYKIMDKIMIGNMSSLEQVGYYENAAQIVNVPLVICVALGTVMLPRMSNLIGNGRIEKSEKYIELSMAFSVSLSVAMSFGLAAIAPIFTPIFYGKEFLETGRLMVWLAPTVVFTAWANVIRTQYLIPKCLDKPYIVSVSLGAVVNLIINLLLIPKYDAFGAVLGTFFAEATVSVCQTIVVWKELNVKKYLKDNIIFVVIGVIMFLFVRFLLYFLDVSVITLVISIVMGGICYILLSMIYLSFFKTELYDYILRSVNKVVAK